MIYPNNLVQHQWYSDNLGHVARLVLLLYQGVKNDASKDTSFACEIDI